MKAAVCASCPVCANKYFNHESFEVEMIFITGQDEPDYFICPECGFKLLAAVALDYDMSRF